MERRITVDAMGEPCPMPVVKAKKALDAALPGEMLVVLVDNEIAVQNVMKLAKSEQCECRSEKIEEKRFSVTISAGTHSPATIQREAKTAKNCHPDIRNHWIVAIGSSKMGEGSDELSAVLMKGFLFAVRQLDSLPEKILFYNSGVMLTTEGSDSLEDLKAMEAQGVEMLSCGTCLNYYNRSESLMVGSVTNMYNIVEAMEAASKIIKP